MRRKSFIALFLALLCILINYFTKSCLGIVVAALLVPLLFFSPKNHSVYIVIFIVVSLFSSLSSYSILFAPSNLPQSEEAHTFTLRVTSELETSSYSNVFYAYCTAVDASFVAKEKVKVKISTDSTLDYSQGDILLLKGSFSSTKPQRTFGGYNEAMTERIKGVKGIINATSKDVFLKEKRTGFSLGAFSSNLKKTVQSKIGENMPFDYANVLCGILLGIDVEDEEINELFSLCGISHLLCVSGLHVGYMYLFVAFILSLFLPEEKKRTRFCIVATVLFCYCAFVGFSPGAVRSTLMILFILGAKSFLGEEADSFNALCLCALIMVLINPLIIFDLSFLLSFSCMVGIVLFFPVAEKFISGRLKRSFGRYMLLIFAYTGCILLVTFPICVNIFHRFTFLSFLSGVLILPISCLIFILGMFYLALLWVSPGGAVGSVLKVLINYILVYSKYASSLPLVIDNIRTMFFFEIIPYYVLLLVFFGYLNMKRVFPLVLATGAVLMFIVGETYIYSPRDSLDVAFLDVGHGDSIVISTPAGKHYLIDGGGDASGGDYPAKWIIMPYIYHLGYSSFDGIFITNSSSTQMEGAKEIASRGLAPTVYFNSLDEAGQIDIKTALPENTAFKTLCAPETIELDEGVTLSVLYPHSNSEFTTKNNSSLVLLLSFEGINVLLPSNISKSVWLEEVESFSKEESHVMKASYYGNYYDKIETIYDIIDPKSVVVSCGNNRFGLPKQALLDMLKEKSIPFYTTRDNGTIILRIKDSSFALTPYIK